ncbi:hypothetical protein ACFFS2_28545 [Streptomyces aurantiacus]|uniref:Uncharacterized protein n=1 Tax=Streptomyces aurantiacus TaxID=47760 RepID=A0A7G1NUE6_9ACTN|nr:hypothetical protein [Streptomyces aurantiacus]BCL26973.1 hypothetical protein GCM10017557_18320 [Streptomyces aurantiacus]
MNGLRSEANTASTTPNAPTVAPTTGAGALSPHSCRVLASGGKRALTTE